MPKTPLRKAREVSRLTQDEVAARAQIDQSHYARIELGRWGCSAEVAARLARIFKRRGISEVHILYPRRYRSFQPEA
jgi:transcriptional regulator with XRE-family HTH domain